MFYPSVEFLYIDVTVVVTCAVGQMIFPDSCVPSEFFMAYVHTRYLWADPVGYLNFLHGAGCLFLLN
jgi:hypothetical protein